MLVSLMLMYLTTLIFGAACLYVYSVELTSHDKMFVDFLSPSNLQNASFLMKVFLCHVGIFIPFYVILINLTGYKIDIRMETKKKD